MHWGIEYVLLPNRNQKDLADFLIDSGVDIIIGGHPHVIQPMEVLHSSRQNKNVLVVYSLGNFISNMKTADTRGGALVRVRICRDKNGKAIFKDADYDLLFAAKPAGANSNFKVYPSHKENQIPASQQRHWQLFKRGALKIFNQHNREVPQKSYPIK